MRPIRRFSLALLFVSFAFITAQTVYGAASDNDWWKHAVIYEVYPRSFGDTNGDGVGDLNGITEHLDYLKELGVDAIWITPFYPSPQVDFGYDISNFRGVDPQFGTMADFDRMEAEAKKRGIRIIVDFVLNHTSDQHPWFIESKSSRTNPKANWYVWHDGKSNGQPPNNWQSIFGHSAWQYVDTRKQYYYHAFYKEQPDLNWHDKDVRNAMFDVTRFWMQKGVSGFRLDAVTSLFEDLALKDEPYLAGTNAYGDRTISRIYTDNLPELHEVLRQLRRVINEFPGRVLIGETYVHNIGDLAKMYGRNRDELQLPMDTQLGFTNHLSVAEFRTKMEEAETKMNANVPLFVFENHDNARSLDRYAGGKRNVPMAKLLATILLAPRSASLVYYGEELGMMDNDPKRKEDVKDPIGKLGWPRDKGRDGERTPMQWNNDRNAGFSSSKSTWLPVNPDYKSVNVSSEEHAPDSILNYYKTLIRLRKENPQLRDGDFVPVDESNNNVLSFLRKTNDGKAVLVTLNFTPEPQTVSFDLGAQGLTGKSARTVLASFSAGETADVAHITLPAYGAYMGEVQP